MRRVEKKERREGGLPVIHEDGGKGEEKRGRWPVSYEKGEVMLGVVVVFTLHTVRFRILLR